MSIAFVQEKFAIDATNSTSHVITLDAGVTSGNTLLLAAIYGIGTISSVSGCGATWTQIAVTAWSGMTAHRIALWQGVGATTGTSITVTETSASAADVNVSEWSGVGTIIGSATSGTVASASGDSLSLASGDYGYTALGWNGNAGLAQNDTPAPWTLLTGGYDVTGMGDVMNPAYRQAAGTETAQHVWTLNTVDSWASVAAKLSPSSPTPAFRAPPIVVRSRAVSRASVI